MGSRSLPPVPDLQAGTFVPQQMVPLVLLWHGDFALKAGNEGVHIAFKLHFPKAFVPLELRFVSREDCIQPLFQCFVVARQRHRSSQVGSRHRESCFALQSSYNAGNPCFHQVPHCLCQRNRFPDRIRALLKVGNLIVFAPSPGSGAFCGSLCI